MEKERKHGIIAVNKKHIVVSLALSAVLSGVPNNINSEGHDIYEYAPISREYFSPITIYDLKKDDSPDLLIPYSSAEKETSTSRPLTKKELEEQKIKSELKDIVNSMREHNISSKHIKDVTMYYPIYKAVADKYDMDWYLIWIVHERETGASAGKRGFVPSSYYKGAMQRDPNVWSQSFVDNAAKGLKDLAKLPQRHKNDWKEIAAGAAILDRNINKYEDSGKIKAVLKSLILYSSDGEAYKRFNLYRKYHKIFSK